MKGIPFNSTEFLGQYACEVKKLEKQVFLKHRAEIIGFLEMVCENVYMAACEHYHGGYDPDHKKVTIKIIERRAEKILSQMEADLKEVVTKKYILTQRHEGDSKDDKPDDKPCDKKGFLDRLKDRLP